MYTMLKDSNLLAAKKSLDVMIELYKKNVWKDAKTVNVIASACYSNENKVSVLIKCTYELVVTVFTVISMFHSRLKFYHS